MPGASFSVFYSSTVQDGLATDGITIIDDIVYIQRGYERFDEKLKSLGAVIEKVETERDIQKFKLKVG